MGTGPDPPRGSGLHRVSSKPVLFQIRRVFLCLRSPASTNDTCGTSGESVYFSLLDEGERGGGGQKLG